MTPPQLSTTKHLLHTFTHAPPLPPPLSLLADKCKTMRQLKQIHGQMITTSRITDNFAASRLIAFAALSDAGDLNYAHKLFANVETPNGFMWNTLIRGKARTFNKPHEALLLYVEMRRKGVVCDGRYTIPFVLKGVCGIGSLQVCEMVHGNVVKFGLEFDLHVGNGLLRCYSVLGEAGFARKVFEGMSVRGLGVWTSLICGYAQNGWFDEALGGFDKMVKEGFEPNGATLASVLSVCGRSGSLDLGEKIFCYMEEKGFEVGVILGTALVDMYAKNGVIVKARRLFDAMKVKNVATWNAMICGLASCGHAEEALDLFRRLENENVVPNDITLVGVLSACCHAGLVDVGCKLFDSMEEVYGIEPKIEHYGCMVDLLGRAGKVIEAEQLLNGMAWKPDVKILGALLSACQSHGNIEVAERVVDKIVNLESHNHGGYVVLSNMYAKAGRWGDVLRLRKVIRKWKLNKIPGWSHVDNDS